MLTLILNSVLLPLTFLVVGIVYPLYRSLQCLDKSNDSVTHGGRDFEAWLFYWVVIALSNVTVFRVLEYLPLGQYLSIAVTLWLAVPKLKGTELIEKEYKQMASMFYNIVQQKIKQARGQQKPDNKVDN